MIAALAPLLGLLGTVMGMMEAFSAMAATEGRANASQLSGGIYEALMTTAAGLIVAIPFAALAAWIEFRLRRIHKTINSALVSVFKLPLATKGHSADQPHRQPSPALRGQQRRTGVIRSAIISGWHMQPVEIRPNADPHPDNTTDRCGVHLLVFFMLTTRLLPVDYLELANNTGQQAVPQALCQSSGQCQWHGTLGEERLRPGAATVDAER